jgi:hypothetical protein
MLPWKLYEKGLIIRGVVVLGSSVSLGVYRREDGEETINIKQTIHHEALHGNMLCRV